MSRKCFNSDLRSQKVGGICAGCRTYELGDGDISRSSLLLRLRDRFVSRLYQKRNGSDRVSRALHDMACTRYGF